MEILNTLSDVPHEQQSSENENEESKKKKKKNKKKTMTIGEFQQNDDQSSKGELKTVVHHIINVMNFGICQHLVEEVFSFI